MSGFPRSVQQCFSLMWKIRSSKRIEKLKFKGMNTDIYILIQMSLPRVKCIVMIKVKIVRDAIELVEVKTHLVPNLLGSRMKALLWSSGLIYNRTYLVSRSTYLIGSFTVRAFTTRMHLSVYEWKMRITFAFSFYSSTSLTSLTFLYGTHRCAFQHEHSSIFSTPYLLKATWGL